ncbi:aspartate--tRNA ligase [Ethanoligenens harbinense]|uniref:Aspartate--tRNA ligase n=1 Tax=Ethanoligenens harbinense (strain DSM 18485 / JCM 12961 / CGMCC 1.5033 / YUAN-3) TaxID=663278 RepID=E6U7D7_ETHHY|nr:aspartate--tRNA ligase [Ethanoligenens harbinense]ADU25872.1 aspartyl-tRNA synthetase [Ethanoligenens harbinense YUAN-3]AVQ95033.1 aspartate--tRNA ligase [Ethanoligenens harbinense YUAN-3]AYF37724.1 aspartate--tRNA ligase [Ethanoligenens harbinense]AYF40445.1 aspartate--tRNA ligase [Ethanoligenens harbinense]QCN91280.1 aspartate--tRNA ligase [Ethanoligenens harbinense]
MADTMQGLKRTDYCAAFSEKDAGREVVVCGWAAKRRDLGALLFIDLRDRSGILQLAFDDTTGRAVLEKAQTVRSEFVLAAKGTIRLRETPNDKLPTGRIEMAVSELRILAKSDTPPFEVAEGGAVKEEMQLRYRYLDLRRPEMQNHLFLRHRIVKAAHDYFDRNGFIEIETPNLIKSTPEGARDYLVPSRLHAGKFYALPQSPQLYKQILMLSGFDRYMQIARCFRDEDLRADRQPEFTQIDLELSFVDEEDIMALNEGYIRHVFKEVLGKDVQTPFQRLPYDEAMARYGSDKPDVRFGMELRDLSETVKGCGFGVFEGALAGGGSVRAVTAEGGADNLSRKDLDKLAAFVKDYGAKGLAWLKLGDTPNASFGKFVSEDTLLAVAAAAGAGPGDAVLIVADTNSTVACTALGALRLHLAERFGLIPKDEFAFLWVTHFPLFEYSEEEGRYMAMHHPFTAPTEESLDKLESDPGTCYARAYDMVLNGVELGGGSIRINDPALQKRMFKALGLSDDVVRQRFGFLTEAFRYGAPPHGGMAYGLDRLVMLMLGCESIKQVIAFPKVQNASELMTGSPDLVEEKQLRELHLSPIREKDI